jgi:hypothetical protein
MRCMIAELVVNEFSRSATGDGRMTNQRMLFPEPAMKVKKPSGLRSKVGKVQTQWTYAFRGPIEGNRLTSSLRTCCLQRTTWLFPRDRPCTRYCDLSRGPAHLGERTIFERPLVSYSLSRGFSLYNRGNRGRRSRTFFFSCLIGHLLYSQFQCLDIYTDDV